VRDPSRPLTSDEPLAMFGFPDGTPLKVDLGAVVDDARPATLDYFTATTDSFYGNSGSPIVDAAGALVGIQNRGAADFVATEAGCNALSRAQPGAASEEQATYAFRALDGLCERAPNRWPCPGADVVHASTACTVTHVRGNCDSRWAALCMMALCLALARRRMGTSGPPSRVLP
jgi:hypothetical protein